MAELARERDWIVLVDEIHQDLIFDGREHIPFATLGDEAAALTVTLTSATKAFNIPGLRCAIAHFGSAELQTRRARPAWLAARSRTCEDNCECGLFS